MIRQMYLDSLPKWESGGNKGRINWSESIGHRIDFIYNNVRGYVEIVDYNKKGQRALVRYKNNEQYMKVSHLKKGAIGNLLGLINHEFIYNKGDIVSVSTGNIEILDKLSIKDNKNCNIRAYQYKCLNDGYVGEVSESKLINKNGCPVCYNRIIIKGVNDISTTHPHLLNYFINPDDAYRSTYGSQKKVMMQCPACKYKRLYAPNKLVNRGFSCRKCGDGISYPEKYIYNLLEQLGVTFETQKVFDWSDKKQYDFYLPELKLIIEAHGLQHYENHYSFSKDVKLKDIQENDDHKFQLSSKQNINKYIILDCRELDSSWIKNSVINSELSAVFDLSNINWLSCHMFACSSRVKEACDLWNMFSNDTKSIAEKMKLSRQTTIKYLKQGVQLGWCNYDPRKNMSDNGRRNLMGKNKRPKT